jgi:hypothetical protein
MPLLKRSEGTRFSLGDKIRILPTIATRFIGQTGTVVDIQMSRRTRTLDKYLVTFGTSEQHLFWDIQLTFGPD